ncbi:MAG: AcvB/VirJ family lysyl-phosphatidylglycerol hydrolase [Gammaproteobacteria bacterium]
MLKLMIASLVLASLPAVVAAAPTESTFTAGRLGKITVYAPEGPPTSVVLFISGDGGWNLGVVDMARHLQGWGALVAGVDITAYLQALRVSGDACLYPAADFEELSHALQRRAGIRDYRTPIVVGYSSGATLAYALAAQAPPGTFAGSISVAFCTDLEVARPWCKGAGLGAGPTADKKGVLFQPTTNLKTPWVVLHGEVDQVCGNSAVEQFAAQIPDASVILLPKVGHGFSVEANWLPQFRESFLKLVTASADPPVTAGNVSDLPLVEVPAQAGDSNRLAVLLTGDGGWAGMDRDVADQLSAAGIPVVALSTLRYFWNERQPDEVARDLDRIIGHYLAAWRKQQVLLIGYSFGANVLPLVTSRLSPASRASLATLNLIAPARNGSLEIHVANWIPGSTPEGTPLKPEFSKLAGVRTLCVYGAEEKESLCPELSGAGIRTVQLPGGHHFDADLPALVREIISFPKSGPR